MRKILGVGDEKETLMESGKTVERLDTKSGKWVGK